VSAASIAARPWRALHRKLGLFLGLWFALVGLTGCILVYEDEIDAWLNPALLHETRPGAIVSPARILDLAEEHYFRGRVEKIRPPARPGDVYRVVVRTAPHLRVESPRVEAMFSPASGEWLGERETETLGLSGRYLLRTVYEFHRNVLLGAFGANVVGIAGFLLMLSAISGFITALPRNRAGWMRLVRIKFRAGMTRVLFDCHRSGGALLAGLLLVGTATGLTLVYLNYVRDIVGVFSTVAPFPVVPWRESPLEDWPSFASVEARVREGHPGRSIAEIHIPSKLTAGYLFYLRGAGDVHRLGDTIVWVHPGSGEILLTRDRDTRTRGEAIMHWLYPLHSGSAFGSWGKLAMFLTGLAPIMLVLTGLWVWQRKRRAEIFEQNRRLAAWNAEHGQRDAKRNDGMVRQ
jgi:uncharacterized iron-regulated membrane protein